MTIETPSLTPMMAQWHACKEKVPEAILFFRLGDFYEAFHDDALLISKELDLTLTKRQEIPMAGVPHHMSETYVDKLIAKGYRVAIAEQMEDPKNAKGLVKREVVRIITPGTVIQSSLLADKKNNFIACIAQVNQMYALAVIEITTSAFKVVELEDKKQLLDELLKISPKELLFSQKWKEKEKELIQEIKELIHPAIHFKEEFYFEHDTSTALLTKHFKVKTLDGFGLQGKIAAINAAGALVTYLKDDLHLPLDHIKKISIDTLSSYLSLDRTSQRHLELTRPLHDGHEESTLLHLLDRTATPMGGRLLKHWLLHPLLNVASIQERQQAISFFIKEDQISSALNGYFNKIRDLERLIMRIETGFASPRDLAGLRYSLEQIPSVALLLKNAKPELIAAQTLCLVDPSSISQKIAQALVDDPPLRLSDGNLFKSGYNNDLDELKLLQKDSHEWMARYQTQLKEQTQIKHLKVGYTKAFGYYIEVSRGALDKIPKEFHRRQTLVNAERYITDTLKDFEHKMLSADERIADLEAELFHKLRKEIVTYCSPIRQIAQAIASLDCLLSLAKVAQAGRYICPTIDESDVLDIQAGRHPVIEAVFSKESFIPNHIQLGKDQRLALITGPNMAGKSTYIRQAALLIILAQMGSFIPAKKAHIGIIDKVFCRIGASDDLSRGQSTFMVEMTETANILHNATSRSLVILDEIGRGTSTYDGISIAWAVAEYLLTPGKSPKTLFATHYWELTELEGKIPGAVNFNVAVQETEKGIVFLRKIVRGGTDKSYGIHVARLAGLPFSVIKRAEERLKELEQTQKRPVHRISDKQLELFTPTKPDVSSQMILKELKALDPNHVTPLEALKQLMEWKKLLS